MICRSPLLFTRIKKAALFYDIVLVLFAYCEFNFVVYIKDNSILSNREEFNVLCAFFVVSHTIYLIFFEVCFLELFLFLPRICFHSRNSIDLAIRPL